MTDARPQRITIRKWKKRPPPETLVVIPSPEGEHYTLPEDIAHQLHLEYTKI